jgi:hypothetical protein
MKVIKQIHTKSNNARRMITLILNEQGEYNFIVAAKRLVSRKDRQIVISDSVYTIETFYHILHLMNLFTDNDIRSLFPEPVIKNAINVYKNKEFYE